ncbi:MAG: NTP transferase domain-containing protein [SAR324 cluster bacterium]|nr:NTP transferase domain-containing protein [SAR324 cluster bacterium]
MKAVILAANQSERLSPFTETRPKPMIRIAGKYILETTIEFLREVGVRDILLVVNYKQDMIQDYFSYGDRFGVNIEYVFQESVEGIGHALKLCQPILGSDSPLLLVYGDVLADGNIFREAMKTHYETGEDLAVVTLPQSSEEFGNVYLDHEMKIRRLIEKPHAGHTANYVFAGVFVLSSEIFQALEKYQNNMEQCYQALIQQNGLQATLWEKGWIDIIYPWHILEANKMMMNLLQEARIHHTVVMKGQVHIEGPVIVEENVTIESGTILKGPCFIGRNSYIGNNALIREYSVLGPDSVIGYGSELKNSVLFGATTIGRLSFVGDSVVGENVKLGSGTTTVNHLTDFSFVEYNVEKRMVNTRLKKIGSFIGDDVTVGARQTLAPGTSVGSGKIIPDYLTLSSQL